MPISDSVLFANNTTFINFVKDINSIGTYRLEVLQRAEIRFNANGLNLNRGKTQTLVVTTNYSVVAGDSVNILAIELDDGLRWENT